MRQSPTEHFEKIPKHKRSRSSQGEIVDDSGEKYKVPKRGRGTRGELPKGRAFVFSGFPQNVEKREESAERADAVSDEEKDREIGELLRATIEKEDAEKLEQNGEHTFVPDLDDSEVVNPYISSEKRREEVQGEMDTLAGTTHGSQNESNAQTENDDVITKEEADRMREAYFNEPIDRQELEEARQAFPDYFREEESDKKGVVGTSDGIKNWQELKMDGREELPQVRNEAFRGAHEEVESAFQALLGSRGWAKEVDASRSVLVEEGFLRGVLDKELVEYIQTLEGTVLDTIDDWPRELLQALQKIGFEIGKHDEYANAYEVSTTRLDVTLRTALTPRQAVGFLKTILGLPERARYPFEVEEAFDDVALPTDPRNVHFKPENVEKVQRAREVLKKHEIIRDPNWVFDERFQAELGIYEKDLRAMEGFKELTLPQQKLLFENILEYQATHPESVSGKIWGKIEKTFSPDHHAEKESEKLKSLVAGLVRNMAEYGPRVHETKDGVLIPDVVGLEYHRDHRKEQREASNALNKAAYELAQTPDSWRRIDRGADEEGSTSQSLFVKMKSLVSKVVQGGSEKQHAMYAAREKAYNEAKNAFGEAMRKSGMGESAVMKMLFQIDGRVHLLKTAPEAEAALSEAGTTRATSEIANSFNTKEALAYMGLGAVSKLALKQTFDWAAGPVVASVIGGIKSWRVSTKELARRDERARFGEIDTSKEALNIIHAIKVKERNGEARDEGVIAKTQYLIDSIHELHGDMTESGVAKRTRLLERLESRVKEIESKLQRKQINFGNKHEMLNTITRLYETLGEAHVLLADRIDPAGSIIESRLREIQTLVHEDGVTLEKIAGAVQESQVAVEKEKERISKRNVRIAQYSKYRTTQVAQKRNWYKTKEASKGATKAGAFALLGAGLFELFEYDRQVAEATANGTLNELKNSIKEALATREATLNIDTPLVAPEITELYTPPEATEFLDGGGEIVTNEVEVTELPQTYEIQKGDTLTSVLKEQIPAIKALGPGQAQETAITNFLNTLTPAERRIVGIGENINKIFAGESLNLHALGDLIEKKGIIK